MMLSLQLYDLEVKYVPGSKMYISDTLSRAALLDSDEHKIDDDITIHANMFINSLAVSEKKLQAIKQETVKDVVLQKLREYFLNGWPKHKKNTDVNLRCYWDYRAEIHVIDDIVYKNTSIIIPVSMRKEMLQKIHASHAGINRCKSLARRILFWPSMSKDIEQFVDSCEVCLKYRNANPSEPLIISESPSYPWEKIGADLLQFRDKKYLVIVDYYSKYIELALLNTGTSAKHVIMHFKSVLARHGIPLILMTDNGPPFDSREFASFCHEWDIEHITSSPHFPQSNGQAESAVKIVKKILEKSFEDNTDPYLALLHYRCNEKEYMKSPAELLMSRKLRSNLPISKEMLKPKVIQLDIEQNRMNKHKENYKKYHDKHARPLPELDVNDSIMYKKNPNSHWEHGIVKEVLQNYPRSYIIESKEGVRYRRNRRHLLKLSAKCGTKKIVSPCKKQSDNINDHQPLIVSVPITQMLAQICIPVSDSNDNVRSIENTVIESQPTNDIELTTVESPGSRNENDVLSSDVDSYCSLSQQSDGSCTTYPMTEDIVDIGSSCSSNYLVICENSSDVDLCEGSVRENDNEHNYTTRSGRIIKKPKRFEDD